MSKNKFFMNEDIIEIHVIGDQTYDSVMAMGETTRQLIAGIEARQVPVLILDDLTAMGKTDTLARQAVTQLARTLPYHKVAMVGEGSALMRVGTGLLLQAIDMGKKIKYFEDRQAAIDWLRS